MDRDAALSMLVTGIFLCAASVALVSFADRAIEGLNAFTGPHPQCAWSSAQGMIKRSLLENHPRPNGEDNWEFTVWFDYNAGGVQRSARQQLPQEFAGNAGFMFGVCDDMPDRGKAIGLFVAAHDDSEFFRDRPVIVYFNPAAPDHAVLVPGLLLGTPTKYGEAIFLYGSFILGGAGLYLSIKGFGAMPRKVKDVRPAGAPYTWSSMPPDTKLRKK